MLKNLKIGISFLQALLISDTSYDLEKLDEEEAGEADDQSEEGDYQILKKLLTVANQVSPQHFHNIFQNEIRHVILIWYLIHF